MARVLSPDRLPHCSVDLDRWATIESLLEPRAFTLNVGSREMPYGDVKVDKDTSFRVSAFASVLALPFKPESFDQVIFADVIEHLPRNSETDALREIWRVLHFGGALILSTPHHFLPYTLLDVRWYFGHRHYTKESLIRLVTDTGFSIRAFFLKGGPFTAIAAGFFANRFLLRLIPSWLKEMSHREFLARSTNGYTLFLKAVKGPGAQPSSTPE